MEERMGWIKLHRKILDNPVVCKSQDHFMLWIYLLLNATHTDFDTMFAGKRTILKPGELITGRKSIAKKIKISESKVQRILKTFEIEQQIKQQTTNVSRLISILNWDAYQFTEQANEQQVNNKRTTSEQRVNTNKNIKKVNNKKNIKQFYQSELEKIPKDSTLLFGYNLISKYITEGDELIDLRTLQNVPNQLSFVQFSKLREKFEFVQIKNTLVAFSNKKDYYSKNQDIYKTLLSWMK